MVTDEERDYMYAEYAKDPRMKANVGIRRRLAPLLENDRNQIELFTALLLSLPGSPVLYYGDEIGMGDNIWLGDRDGVRTPMQWTPDRNAGFSTANPGRLYLPANQDPIYGYQAVNVEAQTRQLDVAAELDPHHAGGPRAATTRSRSARSGSSAAPTRRCWPSCGKPTASDVVLCVNNLSRFPQPIELNLQQWNGYTPVELTGHVAVPAHRPAALPADPARPRVLLVPAVGRRGGLREQLMTLPFAEWLPQQRWYAGRSRELSSAEPAVVVPLRDDLDLVLLDVAYTDGRTERYQVIVRWDSGRHRRVQRRGDASAPTTTAPATTRCTTRAAAQYLLSLIDSVGDGRRWCGSARSPASTLPLDAAPRVVDAEQSNTSVIFDRPAILKVFRRVTPGINPDIELNRVLGRAGNPHVARLLGSFETRRRRRSRARSAWSPRTPPTPPRAGRWPPPAPATCSPRATCTPTRSAATSPASRTGSARRSRRCTPPSPRSWARRHAPFPVDTMLARLSTPRRAVPELARVRAAIEERFRKLADEPITVQRVHGDLHLGQVLRTPETWLLIDFEGEPGPAAGRAPPARLAAARRRRDAALLRVRRLPAAGRTRATTRTRNSSPRGPGVGGAQPRRVLRRLRGRRPAPTRASTGTLLARVRAGQGGLRGRLRGPAPAELAADPAAVDRAARQLGEAPDLGSGQRLDDLQLRASGSNRNSPAESNEANRQRNA